MSFLIWKDPKYQNSLSGRAMAEVSKNGPPFEYVEILAHVDKSLNMESGAAWDVVITAAAMAGGIEFDNTDPDTGEKSEDPVKDIETALTVILDASVMMPCAMDDLVALAHGMIDSAAKGKMQ